MQVIITAMRKLLHIAYGVLKSSQPFDTLKRLLHRRHQDGIYLDRRRPLSKLMSFDFA
jgi:hypothetical protein